MKRNLPFWFALAAVGMFASAAFAESPAGSGSLYFPPDDGEWRTIAPDKSGWDAERLEDVFEYSREQASSGLLITQHGLIVGERYFPPEGWAGRGRLAARIEGKDDAGHNIEDVASVQKSVTSLLVGIAQEKGLLKLDDPVHQHMGVGWSRATPEQEAAVTVRHLITMTSGLKDDLTYEAPPGTRWRYNTTAYAHARLVAAAAAGMDANELTARWLTGPLGMEHSRWVERDFGGLEPTIKDTNLLGFATTNRDLASVGLLVLAGGKWGETVVIGDTGYLHDATHPSQKVNLSYGYLWWINGQESLRRGPGVNAVPGPLVKEAPSDLFAGLGALGRKLYVVPSMNLVITRLGNQPTEAGFDNGLWKRIMAATPKE